MTESGADPRRLVMIVEDDAEIREVIAEVLAEYEYRTMVAHNGADALEKLRAAPEPPAVILLDIMMPVMDGWQFRAAQLEDPKLARIPVVMLTAVGDVAEKAAQVGAAGALRKPVQLAALLEAVSKAIG